MKALIILCIGLIACTAQAQQDTAQHKKLITYKVKLTDDKGKTTRGYLAGLNDSTVLLLPYDFSKMRGTANRHAIFDQYPYQNIVSISFRRNNSTGRGIGFGAATGFGVGLLSGLISGEKSYISKGEGFWIFYIPAGTRVVTQSTGDAVSMFGLAFAAIGGVTGGIIGIVSTKHFTINGSKNNFDSMKGIMLAKMYR